MSEDIKIQVAKNEVIIKEIRDNHLVHLDKKIDRNHIFILGRMDKVDGKLWWLIGLIITSLIGIAIKLSL